jgi:TolA-binding protein
VPPPAPASLSARALPLAVHSAAPRATSAPRAEALDPNLVLYRAAHTAHFVDHDPARALAGWDAYIAAAPNGPFAPEARYNRALSLVRLGRKAEARAALEPFANGTHGGYRQVEAQALMERLEE